MSKVTAKQERFCEQIVIGQKLSDAYRTAFQTQQASKKSINERASRLRKCSKIVARIAELHAPAVRAAQVEMARRLKELECAIRLDPGDCFDKYGRPLSIREMPEHVRRAIAGYEVDPLSFVTKVKFVDKRGAIMDYSKLAGDIPSGETPPPPPRQPQYDLSKLTKEEWEAYKRIRQKALVVCHASG